MSENSELLVIGAGQMRTGTRSLKAALEYLLGGRCYHMVEVMGNAKEFPQKWIHVFDRRGQLSATEWRELFVDYNAAVDLPASLFYHELMDVYPNAKVILTIREASSWVRSIRQTTMNKELASSRRMFPMSLMKPTAVQMIEKMWSFCIPAYEEFADEQWEEYFNDWNAAVLATVPKERLLVFRVQEGWEPLCQFLKLPVPKDVPFPRLNDAQDFQKNHILPVLRLRKRIQRYLYAILGIGVAGLGMLIYYQTADV